MRFVAAGGVEERPVNDFLKHQVSAWLLRQVGPLQQSSEVLDVAMHIATDEQFVDVLQVDNPAAPAWRCAKGQQGSSESVETGFGT